ncbi:Protein SPEAR4 [Hirschfeldia incana]|nr:Protein SPEAR4 [Hirschfeldia incana]
MCSKTTIGNYGDDYTGPCPKKQKSNNNGKRRVPRRGPGVAELEKIRLEEQHTPLPPHPLQTERPPSVVLPSPTVRAGPVYPFPSYLTSGSFPSDLIPPAPVFQRNHDPCLHYLPPIVAAKRPWQVMAGSARCDVGPTVTMSRNGKQITPADQRLKNHFQDSGTTIRNPITIDSPSPPIIPNSSLNFPCFMHYEQKDGFNPERPQRSSANSSSNGKPFYSFLPANEQSIDDQDLSISLRTERYDTVTDQGIDLRLKL